MTEIAYVLTPSYGAQLFVSLGTLLNSGSSFDRITVFCIGGFPDGWHQVKDDRIHFELVENLDPGFFFINKTYVTQCQSDRLIYLDVDTLILQPLDRIWQDCQADFIARVSTLKSDPYWDETYWISTLDRLKGRYTPYFNAGFFIFQNYGHHRVPWRRLAEQGMEKVAFDPGKIHPSHPGRRKPNVAAYEVFFAEQIALSLAVGVEGLSYRCMDHREHAFGWIKESSDAVVYHTGGSAFFRKASELERRGVISFAQDRLLPRMSKQRLNIRKQLMKKRFGVALSNLGARTRTVVADLRRSVLP